MSREGMRIRVAMTLPSFGGGGAERVILLLARHLDRERFAPEVIVGRAEGALASDVPADVPVLEMEMRRARSVSPTMLRILRERRPQVHMATLGMIYPAGLLAPVVRARTATILRLGSILGKDFARLAETEPVRIGAARIALAGVARLADCVLAQSETMRDDALRTLGHIGLARRMARIHNPVDIERVRRAAEAERRGDGRAQGRPLRKDATLRLVSAGRFSHEKGHDLLLDALALMRDRGVDAHLVLCGDGPEGPALEAQTRRLGLTERVHFAGFVTNPWRRMADADLMVLPSRYEGFANVLLESLAIGTPAVASDACGDVGMVIRPGLDGEIFRAGSVVDLADAILRARRSLMRDGMREAGSKVAEGFGLPVIVRRYEALFERLAARA